MRRYVPELLGVLLGLALCWLTGCDYATEQIWGGPHGTVYDCGDCEFCTTLDREDLEALVGESCERADRPATWFGCAYQHEGRGCNATCSCLP